MHMTSSIATARKALMSASVVLLLALPGAAHAVSTGLQATARVSDLPTGSLDSTIGNVIAQVMGFVGVLFLILMIYGGFLWMTARGDDKQVGTAKGVIVSAVIGVVLIFSAYAITELVFTTVTPASTDADTEISVEESVCDATDGVWSCDDITRVCECIPPSS